MITHLAGKPSERLKTVGNLLYDTERDVWITPPGMGMGTKPSDTLLPSDKYEWVPTVTAQGQTNWQARLKGGSASGRAPNDIIAGGLMVPELDRDWSKWSADDWQKAEIQRRINRAMDAVGPESTLRAEIYQKYGGKWPPQAEQEFRQAKAERIRQGAAAAALGGYDVRLGPQGELIIGRPTQPTTGGAGGVGAATTTQPLQPGESRIAQEAQERERGKLRGRPPGNPDKYAMYIRVEDNINFIKKNYRPEYVGKGFQPFLNTVKAEFDKASKDYEWDKATKSWQLRPGATGIVPGGIAGAVRTFLGTGTPEEIEFRKTVTDTANAILYAQSGAQINEQEYQRLRAALFSLTDEPATFVAGVNNFSRIVDQQITALLEATTEAASDILKKRRERNPSTSALPPPMQGSADRTTLPQANPGEKKRYDAQGRAYVNRNGVVVEVQP
jgi:hypothetical protein